MKCEQCGSNNAAGANFCQQCGAGLGLRQKRPRRNVAWLWALLCLLLLAGVFYFFRVIIPPFQTAERKPDVQQAPADRLPENILQNGQGQWSEQREKPAIPPAGEAKQAQTGTTLIAPAHTAEPGKKLLPVGVVSVYDPWGNEIAAISTVVFDNSWLALPVRGCLGGKKWIFRFTPLGFAAEIDGGQWRAGDDVALWHLERPLEIESPLLGPWRPMEKVSWRSLLSLREREDISLSPDGQQGFFLHTPQSAVGDEPGVFLQEGRVTGWTFGAWLTGGYLWTREPGGIGGVTVTVADFYDMTFAGGREEQFVRALAMDKNMPAADRLHSFLQGFLLEPKLDPRDIPESLYPENLLGQVRDLAADLYQQGRTDKIVELVNGEVIRRTGDSGLLKIVVDARIIENGYGNAVDFVEQFGGDVWGNGGSAEVVSLNLMLYQLWLEDEIAGGSLAGADAVLARARSSFPDDPRLHLDAVALLLARGDWAGAEGLLWARGYPEAMAERVNLLAHRISQLKTREGEIVIRFAPGSQQIHVQALVNNRGEYPFLVDTGASLVTIPASFLAGLGIDVKRNTPRRKVMTAGGVKDAWEVTLSSLEIDGWVVYDLKALVVDTPQQSDFGLLGLNFLNRFQLHLDSEEGVLILKPQ
ncbi:MAG: TIGR02281 family clan AA aspartic protease [Deltaproteobacteria bacterium]|nr:TIGR02281 family clan AA aspartic protease [Deltaproteobacteria bacterium]